MMLSRRNSMVGGLVAVAATLALASSDASACGNGVELRVNQLAIRVSEAERHTIEGRQQAALDRALSAFPDLKGRRLGSSPLFDRASVVAARAIVRSNGFVRLGPLAPTSDVDAQEHALAWATFVLRDVSLRKGDDPGAATDLGEALERTPERHAEARLVLEHLEKQNVMTTAYGYAALARLRERDGHEDPGYLGGPLRALVHAPIALSRARCRSMTRVEGVCEPQPAAAVVRQEG
jgi:hypothetical protein